MPRILSLDYGLRRTGIATTDPMKIIATGLDTVETPHLLDFLERYMQTEEVEALVVGRALQADGTESPLESHIQTFITKFSQKYPLIVIHRHDEHYTSKQAAKVILQSGVKRSQRRDKALVDKVSAAIILQEFMGFI